jgi:hypothetical protein
LSTASGELQDSLAEFLFLFIFEKNDPARLMSQIVCDKC